MQFFSKRQVSSPLVPRDHLSLLLSNTLGMYPISLHPHPPLPIPTTARLIYCLIFQKLFISSLSQFSSFSILRLVAFFQFFHAFLLMPSEPEPTQ